MYYFSKLDEFLKIRESIKEELVLISGKDALRVFLASNDGRWFGYKEFPNADKRIWLKDGKPSANSSVILGGVAFGH